MTARTVCVNLSQSLTFLFGHKIKYPSPKNSFLFNLFRGYCVSHSQESSIYNNGSVQKYLKYIRHVTSNQSLVSNHNLSTEQSVTLCSLLRKESEIIEELKNLQILSSSGDQELEKLVEEEKKMFQQNLELIKAEIIDNILPVDVTSDDDANTEIQIIPAIGGDEAKLFAEELYNMYLNFAHYKNFDLLLTELRGNKCDIRSAYILLSGTKAHNFFKHEGGVHRVQRVPATEKSGRTHTSTCSVVIYKKPNMKNIHIKHSDLEFEAVRSSGPGGQNVNKRETCIKLKHLPTGITVDCQESRYQFDNKKFALEKLKTILYEMEQTKLLSERKEVKKEQAGTNDYSDKIRTYNFNQNRVTDHRINYSMYNLPTFMTGGKELNELIKMVSQFRRKENIINYVNSFINSKEFKMYEKQSQASDSQNKI
ncbi:hypothetical protein RUM43_007419 [Polyplax serrata]|uniref:Peptide chain release factor domain-containing protein n=1 Tax=Polyplax serrata TaxID=468196 RepID=A0AAN8P5T0_POLSC